MKFFFACAMMLLATSVAGLRSSDSAADMEIDAAVADGLIEVDFDDHFRFLGKKEQKCKKEW